MPPLPQLVENRVEGIEGLGRVVPRQVVVDLGGGEEGEGWGGEGRDVYVALEG